MHSLRAPSRSNSLQLEDNDQIEWLCQADDFNSRFQCDCPQTFCGTWGAPQRWKHLNEGLLGGIGRVPGEAGGTVLVLFGAWSRNCTTDS